MKWVTRRKARVDRIACPWLIQRFIDPDAEFLAFLDKYGLTDPALRALGEIVRGVDTEARHFAREAWGRCAVASGFREISRDDVENVPLQSPVYDALYAYCRTGHA